jgi:hypothetical protein
VTDIQRLLDALTAARVEFVVVGGVAMVTCSISRKSAKSGAG